MLKLADIMKTLSWLELTAIRVADMLKFWKIGWLDMLKLAHIKPAHVLDWLAYWIADMLKLAPILKNGLTDIRKRADIIKTCSWLGLTGILTCWHVKIGSHFEKWADWHTKTGRRNKNLLMTWTDWYITWDQASSSSFFFFCFFGSRGKKDCLADMLKLADILQNGWLTCWNWQT